MHDHLVKGVIHCHTNLSYDSRINLPDLCVSLKSEGFGFIALTEHTHGLTDQDYIEFVHECKKLSTDTFVVLPGLEILCHDGTEIAGVGILKFITERVPDRAIAAIRSQGGLSIWV